MRKSSLLVSLLASLGLAGCADQKPFETIPTPPPEFEATAAPEPTEQPASSERQEPIDPEDQVLFGFDSAELAPQSRPVLDDVASWLRADPSRQLLIRGHADPAGPDAYNLDLSARRAETVAAYLEQRGVSRDQVAITAVGELDAQIEPAAGNRRVLLFAMSDATASR
jgi:OOP family OmpA-OmpF porin